MARQTGPNLFIGTHGEICFYRKGEGYFARKKSSLTAETVKKSAAFTNSRKSAADLGSASRLASAIYRGLPKSIKQVTLYRKLTGLAKLMLKEGRSAEAINTALKKFSSTFFSKPNDARKGNKGKKRLPISILSRSISTNLNDRRQKDSLPLEQKRYFKINRRSLREINAAVDSTLIAIKDILGFKNNWDKPKYATLPVRA